MKYFLLVMLFFSIIQKCYCTEQQADILIYENKEVKIYTYPLEDVWMKVLVDTSYIQKTCMSTSCYRLYEATWEIIDDKLYLHQISDCCNSEIKADLNLIFDKAFKDDKVFSNWFNGRFVIPVGDILYYEYFSSKPVYQYEKLIYVKNGIIEEVKTVSNLESKLSYYSTNKLSLHVLKNLSDKIQKELWAKEFELLFYIYIESDENRKVIGLKYNSIYHIKYQELLESIILDIDDWDILYRHGEIDLNERAYSVKINKKFMKKNKKHWKK